MSEQAALCTLMDRAAISDAVIAYATAVDTRDWALFSSLFADRVFVDFSTFNPDICHEMSREKLVAITRKCEAFSATQHISSNHRHTLAGDRATCVSYMQAGHFIEHEGASHSCFLYGYYTYELFRTGSGWRVDRYRLDVTASQGNPEVFAWAGLA